MARPAASSTLRASALALAAWAVAQASGAQGPREETVLLDLLNAERVHAGLPPLEPHPALAELARAHARDVVRAGIASQHSTGDGATYQERLARTPLDARAAAENITVATDVLGAHLAVMASPRMRAQSLDPAMTHAGVGVAGSDGGFLFVVEDLAALPRSWTREEAERLVRRALAAAGRSGLPAEARLLSEEASRVARELADLDTERLDELPSVADAAFTYTSADPEVLPESLRELGGLAREVGVGVEFRRTTTRPEGTWFVAVLLRGLG